MRKAVCLWVLLACLPLLAVAASEDAPGRVARLSLTQGEVSLAPAGTDEWADAVLNRPLTTGDRVWVDRDARAELQVGSATVHLDQNSGFSFEQLDDDVMRMSLTDGAATVRVRRKLEGEVIAVETPNASVALVHPGEYHIEVNEAGDQTIVKARSGEAAVTGENDSYVVRAAESGVFQGTKQLTADISALGARTAFENWANDRDRREERSVSSRYVSRDIVGYEDLDDDGDWISEAQYGYVWTPRYVHAGWAPYRDGRWAWVSPWGWTWVDNARWGFAPFHYGRWAYLRSRWCWVPGPRHVRPIYAPAVVGWVGSPGVSVAVGIGSGVGWYPLGPREVYVPGYWHSRRYIHNVNVTNTVIVNNTYINDAYRGRRGRLDYRYRHQPNAVTIVPRDAFTGARPVGGHFMPVQERDLRRWHHDSRPPAIAPGRDSVFAGGRVMPGRDFNERFTRAERREAARSRGGSYAGRMPFDAERHAIEANGGRPINRSELFPSNPKDRGDFRAVRPSGRGIDGDPASSRSEAQRGQRREPARSSFDTPHGASPRNSVQPREWANSPSVAEDRARRNSWRTSPAERTPRFETAPARPSFDSVPRAGREDRSSQRVDRQREARQFEPRVQAAPAQESTQMRQPAASPRAWRSGDNGGNDRSAGKHKQLGGNHNTQSQK